MTICSSGARTAQLAIRLGFRQIDGFRKEWAEQLIAARGAGFIHVEQLAQARRAAVAGAAHAGRCRCLRIDRDCRRREALWEARRTPAGHRCRCSLMRRRRKLGEETGGSACRPCRCPREMVTDYQVTRLSLKGHPMQFLRPAVRTGRRAELQLIRRGRRTARSMRVRRRGADPPAAGQGQCPRSSRWRMKPALPTCCCGRAISNATGAQVMAARLMEVEGEVQRSKEGVMHLIARRGVRPKRLAGTANRRLGRHSPNAMAHADEMRASADPRDDVQLIVDRCQTITAIVGTTKPR